MQKSKEESHSILKKRNLRNPKNLSFSKGSQISIQYMVKNFKSASRYGLKDINSLIFKDGKIYNLLEKEIDKRTITCGCVKSNCEAKYCECFRWGETCSDNCTCVGCKNKSVRKQGEVKSEETGCNCVKSGCRKKYCECFQRGRKCDSSCNCKGCLNHE